MIAGLTNATRLFVLTEWRKAIPYLLSPPQHTFSIFVGRVAFVNPAFCFISFVGRPVLRSFHQFA